MLGCHAPATYFTFVSNDELNTSPAVISFVFDTCEGHKDDAAALLAVFDRLQAYRETLLRPS